MSENTSTKSNLLISIITIAGGMIAAAGAIIAATWLGYNMGKDTIIGERNQLERSYELCTASQGAVSILDSLADLKEANETLFRFKEHATELNELTEKNLACEANSDALMQQVEKLQDDHQETLANLANLNSILSRENSVDQEFSLTAPGAQGFFNGEVLVGLEDMYPSWVVANVYNRNERIRIGEYVEFAYGTAACKLSFIGVSDNKEFANFRMICG